MTSSQQSRGFLSYYKSLSLGVKILIWMGMGIAVGIIAGEEAKVVKPIGDLFIRLLLMAAIPLVFFNLVAGITSLSDIRVLGKLGLKTVTYYVGTTSVALTLGLGLAHWIRPGDGMQLSEPVGESFGDVPSVV